MERRDDFTQGAILPALTRFALPVLLALFLQAMYGAVDLQVVGNFGTAADISAVSTGSQILQTITMVICGLAMGVTVLLGQRIGEGRGDEGGRAVGAGIFFFAALSVLVTVGMLALAPQMSELMQAPGEAFAGTVEYVRICSVGMLFIVAYNLLGGIFRGIGDSRMPLITVAIACVLNIGGDLLLVGPCGIGVAGAAIATVFAQAMSVLLSLAIIRRRKLPFTMTRRDIRWDGAILRRVLAIGVPVAAQDLLVSISFLVIIAIANGMGTVPSAGVGVAEKLCAFVMLIPSAFAQSMTAFVAQNVGARRMDRAGRALLHAGADPALRGILPVPPAEERRKDKGIREKARRHRRRAFSASGCSDRTHPSAPCAGIGAHSDCGRGGAGRGRRGAPRVWLPPFFWG